MRILFIGDVYAEVGFKMLRRFLPIIQQDYDINFTIVNAENISTSGKGIKKSEYFELKKLNVDCITLGNHTWFRDDTKTLVDEVSDLLRPANSNPYQPGRGSAVFNVGKTKIRVTSLLGRTFMFDLSDNPFKKLEEIVAEDNSDIHIVDIHAEATSEKVALAAAFDGKVSAVLGTHTHVQTADERTLPKGTAFLTDVGMTGPYDSAIGADLNAVIYRLKTGMPKRFIPATGPGQFCGFIMEFSGTKISRLKRIFISPQRSYKKGQW